MDQRRKPGHDHASKFRCRITLYGENIMTKLWAIAMNCYSDAGSWIAIERG